MLTLLQPLKHSLGTFSLTQWQQRRNFESIGWNNATENYHFSKKVKSEEA